jgi:hypothetical protein
MITLLYLFILLTLFICIEADSEFWQCEDVDITMVTAQIYSIKNTIFNNNNPIAYRFRTKINTVCEFN